MNVLFGWCQIHGSHDTCPGRAQGQREPLECSCPCHEDPACWHARNDLSCPPDPWADVPPPAPWSNPPHTDDPPF